MAPRWVVSCPECNKEFTHTPISKMAAVGTRDPFASPPKPKLPENGAELECRNCGKTSVYRSFDLRYRAD
jgi:endogenous inhibitor of DNA gyrase (YacG/DUF329 family)